MLQVIRARRLAGMEGGAPAEVVHAAAWSPPLTSDSRPSSISWTLASSARFIDEWLEG